MKLSRLCLFLWLGLCLGVVGQTNNLTHEGKSVEEWFRVYVSGAGTRVPANQHSVRNGEFFILPTMKLEADPAWSAFQAFGENAVPFLIQRLRVSAKESEPAKLERRQAVELLHRLGPCARAAGSALLALLPAATEDLNEEICGAAHAVHTDTRLINEFLLGPGKSWSDAQFLRFTRRLGWSSTAVAQRLGGMLNATDRELAREAMGQLETAGAGANAAVDQIAAALRSSDQELRYVAARCLATSLTNTPAARKALQSVLDDSNGMVRSVARRAVSPSAQRQD